MSLSLQSRQEAQAAAEHRAIWQASSALDEPGDQVSKQLSRNIGNQLAKKLFHGGSGLCVDDALMMLSRRPRQDPLGLFPHQPAAVKDPTYSEVSENWKQSRPALRQAINCPNYCRHTGRRIGVCACSVCSWIADRASSVLPKKYGNKSDQSTNHANQCAAPKAPNLPRVLLFLADISPDFENSRLSEIPRHGLITIVFDSSPEAFIFSIWHWDAVAICSTFPIGSQDQLLPFPDGIGLLDIVLHLTALMRLLRIGRRFELSLRLPAFAQFPPPDNCPYSPHSYYLPDVWGVTLLERLRENQAGERPDITHSRGQHDQHEVVGHTRKAIADCRGRLGGEEDPIAGIVSVGLGLGNPSSDLANAEACVAGDLLVGDFAIDLGECRGNSSSGHVEFLLVVDPAPSVTARPRGASPTLSKLLQAHRPNLPDAPAGLQPFQYPTPTSAAVAAR